MTCKPGELIGIPFPYSDLTTRKKRPVLVLTSTDSHGDFMGLAVTSVLTKDLAVAIDTKSMTYGHLPRSSWARCDKIFTLSETLVVRNYGTLKSAVFKEIKKKLCHYIDCNQ